MKIKGTAVKSTPEYVKKHHPDKYDEWLNKLPEDSRAIMAQPIIATDWYPLTESIIIPTRVIAELFFNKNEIKAAETLGAYSAEIALKGVYKIFVMISTPAFMLSRATSIFATYYSPSEIKVIESSIKNATIEIKGFEHKDASVAYRIGGWMKKALEFVKRNNVIVDIELINEPENEKIIMTLCWD